MQDVYEGPGLAGIPRGTAKKLRVVALEYRVARMGYGQNGGECETGLCQTPISLNSGSWDVKHVLGEVDIEADGSCSFEVPAHTPVYFQVLDAKGYTIQSMRSWSTLQNGERFSCIGCHENKMDAGAQTPTTRKTTMALSKPIQKLKPFAGKEHPLVRRLASQSWLDSVENYLGVNAPRSLDADAPVDGFSFVQEIQPIFDRHCVSCHNASKIGEEQDQPDRRGGQAGEREADRRRAGGSQTRLHAVLRHHHHLRQSRQEPVDDVAEAPQPRRDAPAVPHGGVQEQDHGLL